MRKLLAPEPYMIHRRGPTTADVCARYVDRLSTDGTRDIEVPLLNRTFHSWGWSMDAPYHAYDAMTAWARSFTGVDYQVKKGQILMTSCFQHESRSLAGRLVGDVRRAVAEAPLAAVTEATMSRTGEGDLLGQLSVPLPELQDCLA